MSKFRAVIAFLSTSCCRRRTCECGFMVNRARPVKKSGFLGGYLNLRENLGSHAETLSTSPGARDCESGRVSLCRLIRWCG